MLTFCIVVYVIEYLQFVIVKLLGLLLIYLQIMLNRVNFITYSQSFAVSEYICMD